MIYFEWLGVLTGIAGAYFLGSKKAKSSSTRFYGFCLFALSNFGWIVYGVMDNMTSIIVLQLAFTVTTVRGLINNRPKYW